ncbi:MAG TPA: YfiR family protein [Burkholderiales bacterium]|nr:YfiR family protein [Burkholderiales bacterium]
MLTRLALCFGFLLLPLQALAQAQEHELKAAYLYRFLTFIEWPAQPRAEGAITIGVMGADDVLAELQEILPGRAIQGRPIAARRVREGDSLAGLQMVFIGRAAPAATGKLPGVPGLVVVSDADGALDRGATVAFVRTEGRVRFQVSLEAAERQGVRISSRMLSVAEQVRGRRL